MWCDNYDSNWSNPAPLAPCDFILFGVTTMIANGLTCVCNADSSPPLSICGRLGMVNMVDFPKVQKISKMFQTAGIPNRND